MRTTLTLITYLVYSGAAIALGTGGCGSCGLPESLEEDAKSLQNDFEKLSFQELLNQQILETLCENNNCGSLSEAQASRLLDRAIAYNKEQRDAQDRWESILMTRIGVVFSFFGLVIAWLAYRQSRDADRRSVRNEVEIEHLVDASKVDRGVG